MLRGPRLRRSIAACVIALLMGVTSDLQPALADADAPSDFRRAGPYTFHGRGGAPWERSLGFGRTDAWVADDGATIVTAGGNAASLLARGTKLPLNVGVANLVDASFAPDMRHAALVQTNIPLALIDLPTGTVIWQRLIRGSCGARWMSPTVLIAHDYWQNSRLWRFDFATNPPHAQALGEARRADACWASPDGTTWLVRDDETPGGVVWLVDGMTGAATVLTAGFSFVVGSPIADRVCVQRRDNSIDCIHVSSRTVDTVFRGTGSAFDVYSAIDDTGSRLVFGQPPNMMVADFASRTVRAVPAITLPRGGSLAILSGGHILATGSSTSMDFYDLDAGWSMDVPIAKSYAVKPVWHRPRDVVVARQGVSGWNLYLDELP